MGIQDFLFGTPDQTGQLDPETKAARNFLLNRMMQLQSAGPVNVPTYVAQTPQFATAGQNQLLAALGMDEITTPSMPTADVGGVTAYTSMPLQTQMEQEFAERAPAQYDFLRSFYMDPVTGEMGVRAYNPSVMGLDAGGMPSGGGGYTPSGPDDLNAQLGRSPYSLTGYLGSYLRGGVNNPIQNPNEQQMRDATPPNMEYDPSSGSYRGRDVSALTSSPRPVYRPNTPASVSRTSSSSFGDTVSAVKGDIKSGWDKIKSIFGG
jgi:hypothetical protein